MKNMPKSVLLGLALYVAALIYVLWSGGMFVMMLGTPILLYQGFLLYQTFRRQNWARIALLVFVLFLLIRDLTSHGYLLGIGQNAPLKLPIWVTLESLADLSIRLTAVAFLFSRPASRWFLSAVYETRKDRDSGWPATPPRVEASNFGFGSTPSIGLGIIVAGVAIGGYYVFSHELHRALPSDADAEELKPGDAHYPLETANPTHVVPFTVLSLELSNYKFNAGYGSDVKLCGHQIGLGGYFPYGLSIPVVMVPSEDGKYRGSIVIDKFQAGKCGWKFQGVAYARPDGVGNAVGVFKQRADFTPDAPHIDMWCYRVTEGKFKSPDPKCETLAMLRWPDAERRANPEFLAKFSHEQLDAKGAADITTETKELTVEFHDLNVIPGALIPVGDRAAQIKAAEEARATIEASPEGQARQCFERANLEYARTRPPPDTATDHTQRDTVLALKNKCRTEFGVALLSPEE
jgi:hypothetical protein